ncbi:MMPL family transporter [Lentibacillus cibarius]|uniref:MMPL family transporter n=1 Tax=Lentibacillus cibarius TaxID=2583219 RepID=A0A549YIN6_9BACI|nr:MMPL family transporter [Lentibacillus cibarius]TRM11742.1 MMPL family transporter [Lentibacillus cibarius]
MKLLNWVAKLLRIFPMKSIFITIIIIILLATGIPNVFMATGNDTLVEKNTDVYQDNQMLEEEFGGESIMVLYESDNLLTPNHLEHMKGLENELNVNDAIFSTISPVTLVEEIAMKQSDKFHNGITDIIDGLNDMGNQLSDRSKELKENAKNSPSIDLPETEALDIPTIEDPKLPKFEGMELPEFDESEFPDMNERVSELNNAFSKMIEAQKNLENNTENLVNGYAEFSEKLTSLGQRLLTISKQMEDIPQKDQLKETSQNIIGLAKRMKKASEDAGQLPTIPAETITGLNDIQGKLTNQLQEQKLMLKKQKEKLEQLQGSMQKQQEMQQEKVKQKMEKQKKAQKGKLKRQIKQRQAEKEAEMQRFKKNMQEKQQEQADMLNELSHGLSTMGEKLQSISENLQDIYGYSDIMTPGLPTKQATLDNMIYDEDNKLRPMFDEVIVDDNQMLMIIKLKGNTDDVEKSAVIDSINDYLDAEDLDSVDVLVSGKPVLDHSIKESMKKSIQKMMGLALLIMVIVLFFIFKVRWRLFPLLIVLTAIIGTVGLMGWLQIPITMVSMAVFPILIGLGIDYAIQFQNRHAEEMAKEDWNESE